MKYYKLYHLVKPLLKWCEENEVELNAKAKQKLLSVETWQKHQQLVQTAQALMTAIGNTRFNNFNVFKVHRHDKESMHLSHFEAQK